jgi:hypothetical protein
MRLGYLAMNHLASLQVDSMLNNASEPPVTVWSAHDSTLIGLLSRYRLQQPSVWPEYASYFLAELIEVSDTKEGDVEYMVRFSLNGEQLSSQWHDDESLDMIPLSLLAERLRTQGASEERASEL